LIAVAASIMVITTVVQTWRTQRHNTRMTRTAAWLGAAFLIEALLSVFTPMLGYFILLKVLYSAAAGVTWALLIALLVQAGLEERSP